MKQNNANGRNIFLVPNADVLADLDFETWLPLADGHKREQLQSMRRQVANISLVGILLAKYAIHTKWNIPIDQIRFGIGSHGKPYVIGYEQVHFNISHSDNICICAVDDMPIGIDIQKMKPCRFDFIAKRFFYTERTRTLYHGRQKSNGILSYVDKTGECRKIFRCWISLQTER